MTHQERQRAARDAKAQRKAKLAQLEADNRFYAERRAKQMYIDIDAADLKLMLERDDLIPECESVKWLGQNGQGGIRILVQKI